MSKNVLLRVLAPRRPDHSHPRPACRLSVEPLEGRLLLSGDMVLLWNSIFLAAARTAGQSGGAPQSRYGAIVQAAVFDAVNSIDQSYTPYLAKIPTVSGASVDAAAAQAAHDALVGLFPAQASVLDLELKASLQTIPDGEAKTAGILVGQAAAQNILTARANDGSDKMVDYAPGTNPGEWQPTPPAFGPPLFPQWPMVKPFCLQSSSQFRPPAPPALTSAEYTAAFNEVKEIGSLNSTTRTADQTEAALFWQGIVTPTNGAIGQWNLIAQEVAIAKDNTLVQNARLLALLNLAMGDGAIAGWDGKYTYNFWRPVTAIRAADTDSNPDTEPDPNWTPLFATPSHPSYPSAHSSVSMPAATVLAAYFGTDAIPFTLSYEGLPGVTRAFDSFSAAAHEAGQARIWAGIHWSFDIAAAEAMGQAVGTYVFQNFLLPAGNAPRGPGHASIFVAATGLTAEQGFSATPTARGGQPTLVPGAALNSDTETPDAGLSREQHPVYLGATGTVGNGAVSEPAATVISRAALEKAQFLTHASSVDEVFSSAQGWEGSVH